MAKHILHIIKMDSDTLNKSQEHFVSLLNTIHSHILQQATDHTDILLNFIVYSFNMYYKCA
jgi:hypothetical protein